MQKTRGPFLIKAISTVTGQFSSSMTAPMDRLLSLLELLTMATALRLHLQNAFLAIRRQLGDAACTSLSTPVNVF